MKKIRFLLFIIGIGLTLFGVFSAIKQSNVYWYSYFTIGVFLVCDYVDYQFRGKSVLSLIFDKNFKAFFSIYFLFVLAAVLIEICGRVILKMWYYPNYDLFDYMIHVFIIGYPFSLLATLELYQVFRDLSGRILRHKSSSVIFLVIITAIVSGLIHEVPNTFSYEWVYQNIPFVKYEIWDVNILVLTLGWIFLTIVSIVGYNLVMGDKESLLDKFRQGIRGV